jgi:hypothetical protein
MSARALLEVLERMKGIESLQAGIGWPYRSMNPAGENVGVRFRRPLPHLQKILNDFSARRRVCRGSDPRHLRLTMDGLLDRHMWGATPCIKDRPRRKVRPTQHEAGPTNRGTFYGQIGTTVVTGRKDSKKNFVPHDGHSTLDDIFVTPLPGGGCIPT